MAASCWKCHELLKKHMHMNTIEMRENARPPLPGDITICGGCGEFSIFDGLLQLRKPDPMEERAIKNTPALMDMQDRMRRRA